MYGLEYEQIDVVYHPESIVHAMVEYVDGSVKAQLAEPDMRLPIQYALLWDRAPSPAPRFDWSAHRTLHFGEIDLRRYACFAVVLDTARSGDLGAMVGLSAADELAVDRFLHGDIAFTDIAPLLQRGAELGARAKRSREPDLDEIVRSVERPGGLHTILSVYRAKELDGTQNRSQCTEPLTIPVLAVGGAWSAPGQATCS